MPYGIKTIEIKVNTLKILDLYGTVYIKNSLGASVAEVYDDKNSFSNGDLVINGNIMATNSKPFWVAGKVNGTNLNIYCGSLWFRCI